jgi:hypothetical protein
MSRLIIALFIFIYFLNSTPSKASDLDHEAQVIDKFLAPYGRGITEYDAKKLRQDVPQAKLKFLSTNFVRLQKWQNEYQTLINKFVEPLLRDAAPEIYTDSHYNDLYEKTIKEGFVNFFFIRYSADLYNESVDDQLNVIFDVAHPIYDVLFDDSKYSDFNDFKKIDRIGKIIQRNYDIQNPNPLERALIAIVKEIDRLLPTTNREQFFSEMLKLHNEQVRSIQQHDPLLDDATLREITFKKGGYSMRLYVLLTDRVFQQDELDTYFLLGAYLQSVDDFVDISEDKLSGISTLTGRGLINPADQWHIQQIIMSQIQSYTKTYAYDKASARNYSRLLNYLLINSSNAYDKAYQESL